MSGMNCRYVCWAIAAVVGIVGAWIIGGALGLNLFWRVVLALLIGAPLAMWLPGRICVSAAPEQIAPAAPARRPPAPAPPSEATGRASSAPSDEAPSDEAPSDEAPSDEQPSDEQPSGAAPARPEAPQPAAPVAVNSGAGHWTAGVAANSGGASAGRGQTGLRPSAALSEEATLRDGVGVWRYEGGGAPAAKAKSAPPPSSGDVDYDGDGVIEGVNEGAKPATLSAARDGGPDDLKKIKGVGPKMEGILHGLGFYHFDQVASWSADEVAWVDANLEGFKGRVSRDEWVAQAKLLAAGEDTEFSKKVDKGGVY